MKNVVFILAFFSTSLAIAQSKPFKISGTIIAEEDGKPLEAATVFVNRVADSSMVSYTISNVKGNFVLEGETRDKTVHFFISFMGYADYFKEMQLDRPEINLDTIEFNARSFKTRNNANVAELLRKLPGVEIGENGTIKVNGQEVDQILVNGKPFFPNDTSIATQRLQRSIIEKVQVTDTRTESEAFTGEVGNSDKKTINLTVKKENAKSIFGDASAFGGTDDRFNVSGMLNVFNDDQRFTVAGNFNNINDTGFGDLGGLQLFNFNTGIETTRTVDMNYNDDLTNEIALDANYSFLNTSLFDETVRRRENILPDRTFISSENSVRNEGTKENSGGFRTKIEPDSLWLITIDQKYRHAQNTRNSKREQESVTAAGEQLNQSDDITTSEGNTRSFNSNIEVNRKTGSKGGFVRLSMNNSITTGKTNEQLFTETRIFGDTPDTIVRDQLLDGDQRTNVLSLKFKKRFALTAAGLFLDAMYNFGRNYNENIQSAFDLDEQTGEYTLFNTDLSTDFRFTDLTSIPGIGFTFQKSKWNINVSASYVSRTLKNEDALRPEVSLERSFDAMEAGVGIRWNNMGKNLSFNYGLRNSPPSLNQLQPFEDISNPLNRVTGNPDLSPTITHRFDMFYRAGQFQKGRMFNLVLTGSFINDKVISQTIVDDNLLSNTTFTNVSGDYSVMTRASYIDRITFDKKRKLNYTFSMMSLLNRTVNFNNDVQYSLLNTTLIPSVNLHFEWNDLFEFRSSYRISLTRSEFDLDIFENTEFVTHDMRISWISTFPKRLQWNNVLTYNFNPQVGDGFQRSTWLLNSTLTYQVFKDQGEITLTMYDLLNQNTNVRRIANANFIEDVSNTVLTQYAMLGFTWRFNGGAKRPSLGQLF